MIPFIRKVGFAVMTTLLLLQASFAIAADPVLTREVILKDDRTGAWVINPNTIINLEDGGFVVAGNIASNQSAWAVRTDSQGNVLWRYDLPIRERRPHAELPDFQGATEMPDGSVYLCGHMPRPIGVSKPALLVHLDKMGGSPSERLMSPSNEFGSELSISYFDQCLSWGDGIVAIGRTSLFYPANSNNLERTSKEYFWIVMLKASGEMTWEKLIPTSLPDGVIATSVSAEITKDGNLVAIGRRRGRSEILSIGASGGLLAQKKLNGMYALVKPALANNQVQVFSNNNPQPAELLTLNDRLEAVATKVEEPHRLDGFEVHEAYRMSDNSLALFGSSGNPHRLSRVAWLSPTLDALRYIDLAKKPFSDGGFVAAATPTGKTGEFAGVREIHKNVRGEESDGGAALDFIDVK